MIDHSSPENQNHYRYYYDIDKRTRLVSRNHVTKIVLNIVSLDKSCTNSFSAFLRRSESNEGLTLEPSVSETLYGINSVDKTKLSLIMSCEHYFAKLLYKLPVS